MGERKFGTGAFWTIGIGLALGVPLFTLREVTSVWTDIGLPEIRNATMSSILMFIGIAIHLGL